MHRDPEFMYTAVLKLICLALLFVSVVVLMLLERRNMKEEREEQEK